MPNLSLASLPEPRLSEPSLTRPSSPWEANGNMYQSLTSPTVCRYLPVMKEFMTMASVRLGEMEDLFTDMKSRVSG